MNDAYHIFAGRSNPLLAKKIAARLGASLGRAMFSSFSDGETRVEIEDNVRGRDVYLIQSLCAPANDHVIELLIAIDALKRASAASITAILPYYGYARQDRKMRPRVPITARLIADLLTTAGVDRIVTVDVHAAQIQGFFDGPFDNLYARPVLIEALRKRFPAETPLFISPDAGGVERTRSYAKRMAAEIAIIDKRRPRPGESEVLHVIGDVTGRDCIIIDDIIDTAGTLTNAADALMKHGARSVMAAITHPVLSGPAIERITASALSALIVTDTIPLSERSFGCTKIQVASVSDLLAETIRRIHHGESVSALFEDIS